MALLAPALHLVLNARVDTGPISSSAAWVQGLLRLFGSQGVVPSRLFAEAGIDLDGLDQPGARLDLEQVNRLWRLAVAATGQATLGLDRDLAARHIDLEIGASWAGSAATLWSVLESQERYAALVGDASAFTLEREHPNAWIKITHGNDLAFPRQRIEYAMLAVLLVCQRATRTALRPLAAEFVFPEPADVHPHRMAFACPLRFGRPVNRLLLSEQDLLLPVASGSPSLPVLEERVLESLLEAFGNSRTSFRVAQELVRRLRQGEDRRISLAASVGLSEDLLARQLRAESTSIDGVLDRVRRELAHEYLAGSDAPIAGIPALLGLRDEAELSAAAARWFGQEPAEYRLHHGPDLPPA
jgi:AraC-like DNA-binding protein